NPVCHRSRLVYAPRTRLPIRSALAARWNVAGWESGPFAKEEILHLFEEELLRFLGAEVEAVLVHDHLHMLHPQLPGLFGDVFIDALAEGVAFERHLVEAGHFLLELNAMDHASTLVRFHCLLLTKRVAATHERISFRSRI